jgi:riboflavin kinase/FMN adenylyltransferase
MRIFRHYHPLPQSARGTVAVIGNFDGVHRGHRAVIAQAGRIAGTLNRPRAVVTFEPHPRAFFFPERPPFRLTPLRIKAHCIESLGVENLIVLHFDHLLASLTPEEFVAKVLVEGLGVAHVVVGYNFVFGKGRAGNATRLAALAAQHGFGLTEVPLVESADGYVYSSTGIREHLTNAQPAQAATLLGRCWEIEGRVVAGDGIGKTLGMPTANIAFEEYLRPSHGIYAVRAGVDKGAETQWHDAVASFGTRPTLGGAREVLEVHLFDYAGDLYGKHLRVALVEYLRPQAAFDGLKELGEQMIKDGDRARQILAERQAEFRVAERRAGDAAEMRDGTQP